MLPKAMHYKDLGDMTSNDHKTMSKSKTDAGKGYSVLWAIRKSPHFLDGEIFRVLCHYFVRLHSEYEIQAASPCFKYEADVLERV